MAIQLKAVVIVIVIILYKDPSITPSDTKYTVMHKAVLSKGSDEDFEGVIVKIAAQFKARYMYVYQHDCVLGEFLKL